MHLFIGMILKKNLKLFNQFQYLDPFKNYFIVLPLASEYVLQMFKHA